MRRQIYGTILLLTIMMVTVSNTRADLNKTDLLFQFESQGYIVREVTLDETIPLNNTSGVRINMTKSGTQGVNFTLVVLYNESAIVPPDYNDYEDYYDTGEVNYVFIKENFTQHYQWIEGEEYYCETEGLLRASENSTDDPYKILVVMYYEGTGPGEISVSVSLCNVIYTMHTTEPIDSESATESLVKIPNWSLYTLLLLTTYKRTKLIH